MHGCENDHTHIQPFACSRVKQMPPVIAINLSLHADANPILRGLDYNDVKTIACIACIACIVSTQV